jgi:hypothetical protein
MGDWGFSRLGRSHMGGQTLETRGRGCSAAGPAVSIRDDVIVKTQERGASQRERLRTLAGRTVGEQTGLFVVPQIVAFDDARGEIVFERLPVVGLQAALSEPDRSVEIVGRAARALAAIHGRMELGKTATATYPGAMGISQHRNLVPLHGDFAITNVLYLPALDRIAIIDWANAVWIGVDADLGAPEIDIAVFLTSLFHRRLFSPWSIPRRHELARHFLAKYASASPHGLDIGALSAIVATTTPTFIQLTRRLRGSFRAMAYRHAMIDLELFVRRLSRDGLAGLRERHTG